MQYIPKTYSRLFSIIICTILLQNLVFSQDFLPPLSPWNGESEKLIVGQENPWITPAEGMQFEETPNEVETNAWLQKLAQNSDLIHFAIAGKSALDRPISYIIATKEKVTLNELGNYSFADNLDKPSILVQAGIHSGEIDGKDAGMMLLRDIAFNGKENLLDKVNLIFVPILSVDGHENSSAFNRPNQRGPQNMGWRTNARNLNLNRDYTKIETEGIQAITKLMKTYDPVFYIDIHVTDGADYQYDITYGFRKKNGYSPAISSWLIETYKDSIDKGLRDMGHIPGPLIFTYKSDDFENGIIDYALPLRFSDAYGDARHIPSVLVENHSLKPYRQRVLGTYIYLEKTINCISSNLESLQKSIQSDKSLRRDSIPLNYGFSKIQNDTIELQLIEYKKAKSDITGRQFTQWTAQPVVKKVPYIHMDEPQNLTKIPKAYWLSIAWKDVIKKLEMHNIQFEIIEAGNTKELIYDKVEEFEISMTPSEGRMRFKNFKLKSISRQTDTKTKYIRVPTDQPLGTLAILLLEANAADSFFQWGYFNEILSRTEYIESYVMEPMILKMLEENAALKKEFEDLNKYDPAFTSNSNKLFQWFYEKTPYFDKNWKIVPIGKEF